MNKEEFDEQFYSPVNLHLADSALTRFINGRGRLSVPASPNDGDMLISRTIRELTEMRILLSRIKTSGSELLLQYENMYGWETELSKEFRELLESV